jgi:hypothetical protein
MLDHMLDLRELRRENIEHTAVRGKKISEEMEGV